MFLAFTICSANYLSYACLLHRSMKETNPSIGFTVFLADEWPDWMSSDDFSFPVIPVSKIGCDYVFDMAARYQLLEFNTAIKPFCFKYIFSRKAVEAAIYLDPDILAVSEFTELTECLSGNHNIVLTPHSTKPFQELKNSERPPNAESWSLQSRLYRNS